MLIILIPLPDFIRHSTAPMPLTIRPVFTADGSIRLSQLALVPHYDQKYLVLPAIGLPSKEVIFQAESIELEENVTYLNIPGWYKMDAEIYTNMPAHRYRTRQLGYLQYGSPKGLENVTEDYRAERLCARAYCRFFEEYNATVVLYIMAKNKDIAEQIDRKSCRVRFLALSTLLLPLFYFHYYLLSVCAYIKEKKPYSGFFS